MHDPGQAHLHEPLSRSLSRILAVHGEAPTLTVNQVLERTQGRGIYFAFIVLSLPFVFWVSLPGMSVVLGLIIAMLSLRVAFASEPRLPSMLGDRRLPPKVRKIIVGGGSKFCRLLESISRPRRTRWMTWRCVHMVHALLITVMALLLALPLPPFPFIASNALPSYAIVLIAVAMMEEDGAMIWLGYVASLGNLAYFIILGNLAVTHLAAWVHTLQSLLSPSR